MGHKKAEYIGKYNSRKMKKWLKRQASKLKRRLEKLGREPRSKKDTCGSYDLW